MANANDLTFTRLSDGTLLRRQDDGSFRPVASRTDHARLAATTDEEMEATSASDPDHAALDEAFWADVAAPPPGEEAISIELDRDILPFFRREGRGYQTRITAVPRSYMQAEERAG